MDATLTIVSPLPDAIVLRERQFTYLIPTASFDAPAGSGPLRYDVALADGSALPSWLRFDAATVTIQGIPPLSGAGPTLALRVTATAGDGTSASDDLVLRMATPNRTVFAAADASDGIEPWITDGTSAGTQLLKDLVPGSAHSFPGWKATLGDGKLLIRTTQSPGEELWVSDGTREGTTLLKSLAPNPGSNYVNDVVNLDTQHVLFRSSRGNASELWISDGTVDGTVRVVTLPSSPGDIELASVGNGKAVFRANSANQGYELWVTDGSTDGTRLLKDIAPGTDSGYPAEMRALGNGLVVFRGSDTPTGYELWVTDGTEAGTNRLLDIAPGAASSSPFGIVPIGNGQALFRAETAAGAELWITNGSTAGTRLVKDIVPGAGSSLPDAIVSLGNGQALFTATTPATGRELWITDGTADGTHLVKDILPGTGSANPWESVSLGNGKALFPVFTSATGQELWVTDGNAQRTVLVKDIVPGPGSSSPLAITPIGNGQALFRTEDSGSRVSLWITDGTDSGTRQVAQISTTPGAALYGLTPVYLDIGNRAPFVAGNAGLPGGVEDQPITLSASALLAGIDDLDGNVLSASSASAVNAAVVRQADGSFIITPAENFEGSLALRYRVTDGRGGQLDVERSIAVAAVADAPTAINDRINTREDVPVTFSALANDFDPDTPASQLTITAINGVPLLAGTPVPLGAGTLLILPDGNLIFTPAPDFNGPFSFEYTLSDGVLTDTGMVLINVDPANDGPRVDGPAAQTVEEDAAVGFSAALGNALTVGDIDGDVLTTVIDVSSGTLSVATPSGVSVTGNGSAQVVLVGSAAATNTALDGAVYRAVADFHGAATLRIATSDGVAADSVYTVALTVMATKDISDDNALVASGVAQVIDVLANDSFENAARTVAAVDGQALSAGGPAVAVANGNVLLDVGGQLVFQSTAGYRGETGFGYTVSSGGTQESARVTVTVANALGTTGADTLPGSAGADLIRGEGGNDTINALAGNDDVDGGDGNDTISGGAGADNLRGGAGNDRFLAQGNELNGDRINGGDGTDTLVLTGASTLTTGLIATGASAGAARMAASATSDATAGSVVVVGVEQFDMGRQVLTIDTVQPIDLSMLQVLNAGRLQGGAGANDITASASADTLYGGAGNDRLNGAGGNDLIIGGTGSDTLRGGAGSDNVFDGSWGGRDDRLTDTFVWGHGDAGVAGRAASQAYDMVYGFNAGRPATAGGGIGGDRLDLRDLLDGETASGGGLANYIDIQLLAGNTVLRISSGGGFTGGRYQAAAEDERITLVGTNLYAANGLGANSGDALLLQRLLDRGTLVTDGG